MADILHRIGIRAEPDRVYAALATLDGLAGWWTHDTSGRSAVGDEIRFRFRTEAGQELGGFDMDVLALDPAQRVHWRVTGGPAEWIGTEIEFTLSRNEGHTVVRFAHRDWREPVEFMAHCSTKWATFLLSLRDLVERGEGRPSPHDVRLGDWH